MSKSFSAVVQEDEDGECFIEFPEDMMDELGWVEGDLLDWQDNGNGSFTLTKKPKVKTEWVLVETVHTFRHRYVVEVPEGKAEYALDTVTCDDAKEFSQLHLGETIVSHRPITKDEALVMCDQDNDYASVWDNDHKVDVFFTPWKE
jgi:hypothetical protein